jgi:hypothetical protein
MMPPLDRRAGTNTTNPSEAWMRTMIGTALHRLAHLIDGRYYTVSALPEPRAPYTTPVTPVATSGGGAGGASRAHPTDNGTPDPRAPRVEDPAG